MKRYAAHYLQTPAGTFLRQQVVEVVDGHVLRYFPLTAEVEDVVWMPGVIVLEPAEGQQTLQAGPTHATETPGTPSAPHTPSPATDELDNGQASPLIPYIYYPFDFTAMRPVAATRRRQLP